ncbi:MAG: relaxase [Pseudomonadota bacterium]
MRGFACDDLAGALMETEAIAKGTRCTQPIFSLSLNPPQNEIVDIEVFEAAIEQIEAKLGLDDQPRAVIFHEKEGRRHAHVVWSRIDAETMTARNMPFFKSKLMDVSREIYLEHGWDLPKGMIDRELRNPLNFTLAEWQQAKRSQSDPRLLKAMFAQVWERSDCASALQAALGERGFFLARGDRRGVVAVDCQGEVYVLSRWSGVRAKDIKLRLGDPKALPSVAETKALISERMTDRLKNFVERSQSEIERIGAASKERLDRLTKQHRRERRDLEARQNARWSLEEAARASRVPRGLGGLWSRLTGKYGKIRRQNEFEALQAWTRDRDQKNQIIADQLEERRSLQKRIKKARARQFELVAKLQRDIAQWLRFGDQGIEQTPSRDGPDRSGRSGPDFDLDM